MDRASAEEPRAPFLRRHGRTLLGLTAIGSILLAGSQVSAEAVEGLVEWIRGAGAIGAVAYAGVYAVATVGALPASWLQGGAGFLWGPLLGGLFAWVASTAFGVLNFVFGRTLLRGAVERRAAGHPRFAAIDRVVGEDGLVLVILLRLSPMSPFNLVSYGLGLTRIRLSHFVLGTFIGSVPAVTLYAVLGASLDAIGALLDGSASKGAAAPWAIGLALTVIASIAITLYARRALDRALRA